MRKRLKTDGQKESETDSPESARTSEKSAKTVEKQAKTGEKECAKTMGVLVVAYFLVMFQ